MKILFLSIFFLTGIIQAQEITGAFGIRFNDEIHKMQYKATGTTYTPYFPTTFRNFKPYVTYYTRSKRAYVKSIHGTATFYTEQEAKEEVILIEEALKIKYPNIKITKNYFGTKLKGKGATINLQQSGKEVKISYYKNIQEIKKQSQQIDREEIKRKAKKIDFTGL
mgnify:CR=1 FL=1